LVILTAEEYREHAHEASVIVDVEIENCSLLGD
jgi:hypothetical protein